MASGRLSRPYPSSAGGAIIAGMTEPISPCPDCGVAFDEADNYCRNCGMYLAAAQALTLAEGREPVPARERGVQPWRPGLPSPAVRAAAAVAVGTALQVGLAIAVRALANGATREAAKPVAPRRRSPLPARQPEPRAVERSPQDPRGVLTELSETVILQRRWRRRD